jgi:ABC-2 type transport system ATP-binding protein
MTERPRSEADRTEPTPQEAAAAPPILSVDGLVKRYGDLTAVDHVSFDVQPGEIYGLLGPNGAGKTTLLSVISGLVRPAAGGVRVGGHSVERDPVSAQRLMGVVPQALALYPDLTVRQNLTYFARLRGLRGSERRDQIATALAAVDLAAVADRRAKTLSGGMNRRLNIAIGLIGRPRLLLLDEPTVGLDPQSRRHILDAVRRLADDGMAVLFTSHYMEEVEYLCRRLSILARGRVIAQGPLDEVRALAGDGVVVRVPLPAAALDGQALDVAALRSASSLPIEVHRHELRFALPEGSGQVPMVLSLLGRHGVALDGMRVESPNLESVFLALTGEGLRADDGDAAPEAR